MQKYRRKGEPVEARRLTGPIVQETFDGVVRRFASKGDYLVFRALGGIDVVAEERFEREYERVEEKNLEGAGGIVYICQACGAKLYDGLKDVVMHKGRNLCQSCYRGLVERERKIERERTHKGKWGKEPKPFGYEKHSYGFHACYICARCGKTIDEGSGFAVSGSLHKHGDGRHREAICVDCWNTTQRQIVVETRGQVEEEAKKPSPLTLADLTPGDVFRLVSHDFCQAKHQLLSAKEFWCSRDRKSITITHSEREVVLIAHHDLTPKQLLWVGASDEERKALDDSIREKWLRRLRGHSPTQPCALCEFHGRYAFKDGSLACPKCILDRAGQRCEEAFSPWMRWYIDTRRLDNTAWLVETEREYELTRDMALSLAAFKPNIDPTRIEVEATPVEWPGVKK